MNKQSLLIRNCLISDPMSSFLGKTQDVLVINGKIEAIGTDLKIENESIELDAKGNEIIPGGFDFQVNCGEPGNETKETFETLSKSAIYGGITGMLIMPSSRPNTDNRGQIEYRKRKAKEYNAQFEFAGNITKSGDGKELAEMFDMFEGGAVAFTDNKQLSDNSLINNLAMQYSQVSGGILMFHPEDSGLRMGGMMHEGPTSVSLGIKGSPSLAEHIFVSRLISIAEYNAVKIHISGISCKESVALIREAKKKNIDISCSVYVQNLIFLDEDLKEFESIYKVWPPFRERADREALKEAVIDGSIDVICSDHSPETIEFKDVEFAYAAYGMAGTQTLLLATLTALSDLETGVIIERLCHNPRKLLGLDLVRIEVGENAEFVLLDRNASTEIKKEYLYSPSINSPFINKTLQGKIIGTYANNQWFSRYN